MKIAEKIVAGIIILACILRLMHLPDAGILLTVGLFALAAIYWFGGYAIFADAKTAGEVTDPIQEDTPLIKKIMCIGVRSGLAIVCIGILFRVQDWPGSRILLYAGLIALAVAGFIVLTQFMRTKGSFERAILLRIAIVGGIGLLMLLIYTFARGLQNSIV